ncbi:mitochondrial RNA 5'-end processing protein [Malassezia pachydermatis]|uniref:Pet127-domain-containing protein n=1 Tax=Malassezia pachydermatis TaxID=77020 RepID=A0A0M9VQI1_9BASI|nr:hypothetical protein Malapachy_2143 [Malassezia pachydermatis]KOS15562.1 hypothetical protein Malapachy_2143 [Malassezia pachydermatis]
MWVAWGTRWPQMGVPRPATVLIGARGLHSSLSVPKKQTKTRTSATRKDTVVKTPRKEKRRAKDKNKTQSSATKAETKLDDDADTDAKSDEKQKRATTKDTGSARTNSNTRATSFLFGDEAQKARVVRLEMCEKEAEHGLRFGTLSSSDVRIKPVKPLRPMEVATLAHGLDRVLFNPGIHWLRDKRTGIYNFDPHLRSVLDVDLFDYSALPPYLTSSRDPELLEITKKQKMKYCGSTSSMTGLLSHCYFLLSRWKEPEMGGFSPSFSDMSSGFSEGAKLPVSIKLQYQPGGFYAVDADKGSDGETDNTNYVLTSLGKSLEKFLTASPQEYAKYERVNSWKLTEKERTQKEAYHYAKTDRFLLRSQLDCQDPRLPNKTFDLKTRAVVSIRNDRANYAEGSGYQIQHARGLWESFEREYWDMVRAAFLKYNFQVRIGHMDGIFVAYHNTAQIFGFQYISLEEMNMRLFGSNEMGDMAYHMSLGLLERILDTATECIPNETLSITMETRPGSGSMSVIVEASSSPQVLQLDIEMDRYVNEALVRGPVDLAQFHGPKSASQLEDMLHGRHEDDLSKLDWHVDYCITPRHDLSEDQVHANLKDIRQRQRAMRTLCLPNVAMLNEREAYRIEVLGKRPDALKRFLEEREDGTAIGMPLAPGQHTTRELIEKQNTIPLDEAPKKVPTTPVRWLRYPDMTVKRVRELSRQGHDKHQQETKTTAFQKPKVYQSKRQAHT